MGHQSLLRSVLIATAILFASGLPAMACTRSMPPRVAGETDEQWMARGRSVEQARFLREADTVFLAELSMIRRVGASDVEITFTPAIRLAGRDMPSGALTMRQHEGHSCRRAEQVGENVVVYATGSQEGHSIIGIVAQSEIIDAEMRRTIRAMARGQLPSPTYPE